MLFIPLCIIEKHWETLSRLYVRYARPIILTPLFVYHLLEYLLMTVTAAVIENFDVSGCFDTTSLSLTGDADTGKWFTVLNGKMEVKVASSEGKPYKRKVASLVKAIKKNNAGGGKSADDMPPEVIENLSMTLMSEKAWLGCATLVPLDRAKAAGLAHSLTYRQDGADVPEDMCLVDGYVIHDGKLWAFSPAVAKTILETAPQINEAITGIASGTGNFTKGGLSALD